MNFHESTLGLERFKLFSVITHEGFNFIISLKYEIYKGKLIAFFSP